MVRSIPVRFDLHDDRHDNGNGRYSVKGRSSILAHLFNHIKSSSCLTRINISFKPCFNHLFMLIRKHIRTKNGQEIVD